MQSPPTHDRINSCPCLTKGKFGPFRFTIVKMQADRVVSQFLITPVNGIPQQPARGGSPIFEWSPDLRQLHIRLDNRHWGKLEVGEQFPRHSAEMESPPEAPSRSPAP